jgi:hypothetical protein
MSSFFKISDLMPGDEVEIPAKRIQSLPLPSTMPLTDDGRFLLVYLRPNSRSAWSMRRRASWWANFRRPAAG